MIQQHKLQEESKGYSTISDVNIEAAPRDTACMYTTLEPSCISERITKIERVRYIKLIGISSVGETVPNTYENGTLLSRAKAKS